jgi:class 3 adenylate cyclase/predicted ATPase
MDVGVWLRGLGLGAYEERFRDNKIDADVLADLSDGDLEKLGLPLGDRKRILKAIASLPASASAATPPEPAQSPRPGSPAAPFAAAERRPITVMFCDLVGSTSLAAQLDAEDWRDLVNAYLDEASNAVNAFGGHVLKKLGDGLMALFGYPQAQENDAERALRAALAIQRALAELNARKPSRGPALSARIGLDSGPVVVDPTGEVFGEAPNVAARAESVADPGAVFATAAVQRQVAGLFVVEDMGAHALKGVPAPMTLYRVVRASGGGRRGRARPPAAIVGRSDELDLLRRRWERARAGEGQFVQIVGEPGIGKSRLVEEFHTRLGETLHTWVEFSSSQLLQNTPLHPIADWGRQRFGDADTPADQRFADLENTLKLIGLDPAEYAPLLAPLVDIAPPAGRSAELPPEELRRRQLAALIAWFLAGARSQNVVIAFEDLHWADPSSLDLIQALAERGAQAPMLILATTRPEFRPPWSLRSHHSVISLSPLGPADVARMVGDLSARHALSQEVVKGVSERTGGVPLFVEEVTRLLLERGIEGGAQAIPPTLQQSLAARLDRLGRAREVAQIGAVLGRGFSFALLRAVAATDDGALQSALDRLAEADLLIVEGAPPKASYRFKHALIQDAAYESLLKSRRQALHRRAAEVLCDDPERAAAEPEVIAHHFTEAGLDDLAIEWWGKAGDQALRRSAFQEAIAHLGKAIEMADKSAVTGSPREVREAVSSSQRLKLQTDYGQAMMWSKGFAAEETKAAYARVAESAESTHDFSVRFAAIYGPMRAACTEGQLRSARDLALTLLREAEEAEQVRETGVANNTLGIVAYWQGDFIESRARCETSLAACGAIPDPKDREFSNAYASMFLALAMWQLGELGRARELTEEATKRAAEIGDIPAILDALFYKSYLELWRGDPSAVLSAGEPLEALAREHGASQYLNEAELHAGWARGRIDDPTAGAAQVRRVLAAFVDQGVRVNLGFYTGLLAELEAETLGADSAIARIDEAFALSNQVEHRCSLSFLHRLRGNILLKREPANPAPAEEAFRTAIAIATEQSARSQGLQAALALAKLYQLTDRPVDAHAVLAPPLEGFAPTPEMPEIAEAQGLLAAVAERDEVKAEVARRQQRRQLHVAYGNALIAARGYGAPETSEAFARARDSARRSEAAAEILAADYGVWVGSYLRGELPAMRGHAATFLRDVESWPESPEAGVAHRAAGITHLFAGEYCDAKDHLERALALFKPGRDDDLAFRFGHDPGVGAMLYLAIALWPMGELSRSRSLVESASANAAELARLADEHELSLWRAFGVLLVGWLAAQRGEVTAGLAGMRGGFDLLAEQNAFIFSAQLRVAQAEAEEAAGDADRGLAILDGALATSERIGHRAFVAELHRARGDFLLRRNPANAALADAAYRTAVAVAKDQGARSLELRAALSLAKLYQSAGRPKDAHAVLAPALEGFSPTPEMPEIAEAMSLFARLG